jgi:hypothetical protein
MSIDIEDFEYALAERFRGRMPHDESIIIPPTSRALAALLTRQSTASEASVSLTARAFFRIRAGLADQLGLERSQILPGTRCRDLMPDIALRCEQWNRFRQWLGLRQVPRLVRSSPLAWTIVVLSATAALVAAIADKVVLPASLLSPAVLLASSGVMAFALRVTRHRAMLFMPRDLTVGQLAHYAVAYGSPILGGAIDPASTSQTLEVIQSLARLEIGTPLVDPDATWEELVHLALAS